MAADLTRTGRAFVTRALGRRRLFLMLSVGGLMVAVGIAAYSTWRKLHDQALAVDARIVIVVLSPQLTPDLRRYRFAGIPEKLAPKRGTSVVCEPVGGPGGCSSGEPSCSSAARPNWSDYGNL